MNWDYIAGFFDGEGSIVITQKQCRLTLPQTHLGVLEAIKKFVGGGSIFHVGKRRAHWKDAWVYYVVGQQDVLRVLENISQRLIVKKALARQGMMQLQRFIQKRAKRADLRKSRMRMAVKLRDQGFTWREIGKRVSMDWSYARKLCQQHHTEA